MKKVKTILEAFQIMNIDREKAIAAFENVPENYRNFLIATFDLSVVIDAVCGKWSPNFSNGTWNYFNWFTMGEPSGAGFSFDGCDIWYTHSVVGARFAFENRQAAKYVAETFPELYKAVMVYERNTQE